MSEQEKPSNIISGKDAPDLEAQDGIAVEIIEDKSIKTKKRYYVRVGTATYGPYELQWAQAFYLDMVYGT